MFVGEKGTKQKRRREKGGTRRRVISRRKGEVTLDRDPQKEKNCTTSKNGFDAQRTPNNTQFYVNHPHSFFRLLLKQIKML